jgi:hypothetical protein
MEHFYVWVCDDDANYIAHHESVTVTRKQVRVCGHYVCNASTSCVFQARLQESQRLTIMVPVNDKSLRGSWSLQVLSDRWLGVDLSERLVLANVNLPKSITPHTGTECLGCFDIFIYFLS